MKYWLFVGCGGFFGALARYALSGWVVRGLPMGTFAANLAGCCVIGLVMAVSVKTHLVSPAVQAFVVGGFLGALTTFSTFGYQTVELMREGDLRRAGINLTANVVLGLAGVWIGLLAGEQISVWYLSSRK